MVVGQPKKYNGMSVFLKALKCSASGTTQSLTKKSFQFLELGFGV